MSDMFDSVMKSFDETIEAAKSGRIKETIFIQPVKQYDAKSVRNLRLELGMTQTVFAGVFGVSKKTVEAWESGRNTPNGPSSRMMDLLSDDHSVADHFYMQRGVHREHASLRKNA